MLIKNGNSTVVVILTQEASIVYQHKIAILHSREK